MSTPRRILVATDFSECSRHAVEVACDLAQALHAELRIVHVWQLTPLIVVGLEYSATDVVNAVETTSRNMLDAEVARVREKVPSATGHLRAGMTADEILAEATEARCDFIVTGTHGRTGIGRALVGSVAEAVVRSSTIPVMTVHQPSPKRSVDLDGSTTEAEARAL